MKGITTNIITFPEEKSYLINFINVVSDKKSEQNVSLKNSLAHFIILSVTEPPKDYKIETTKLKYNEMVLNVPNTPYFRNTTYFYLDATKQAAFIKFVHSHFYFLFSNFMIEYSWFGVKAAIDKFIEIYNLPIDKFDMLNKYFYRKKNKSFKILEN